MDRPALAALPVRCLALTLLLTAPAAFAQPAFTGDASVDQEAYAYGEVVTARFVIRNESGEAATLWGGSGCAPYLRIGTLATPGEAWACTASEVPFVFDARESITWVWTLDPEEFGVPETDGVQTIHMDLSGTCGLGEYGRGDYCVVRDSVSFEASQFRGGPVQVSYDPADADSIRALRPEYGAVVTDSTFLRFSDRVLETWTTTGMPLLEAVEALGANGVISEAIPYRELFPSEVFTTPTLPRPAPARVTPPAPNPTGGAATFTVRLDRAEAVVVDLVDFLGRRVAVLHDGPLAGGVDHRFVLAAHDLPAGVYVVRVVGATTREIRRVTIAR